FMFGLRLGLERKVRPWIVGSDRASTEKDRSNSVSRINLKVNAIAVRAVSDNQVGVQNGIRTSGEDAGKDSRVLVADGIVPLDAVVIAVEINAAGSAGNNAVQ